MSAIVTSAEFQMLLNKRLKQVMVDVYNSIPSMIPNLYNVQSSDSPFSEYFSVTGLPDVPMFNGRVTYAKPSPGWYTKIEDKEFALGVQVERKFLDDKQFAVFDNRAEMLMTSAMRTREKYGVRPLANAFSAAFDFMTREEGVAWCSSSHSCKSGASTATGFDNAGTSALSATSVAATRILMRKFRDDNGERIYMGDSFTLIVPEDLEQKAYEIVNTTNQLDSANNNVNFLKGKMNVLVIPRLSDYSATNWFMADTKMLKKNLLWIDRVKPEVNITTDFETFIKKTSLYMRYGYGWLDWRPLYGHLVS